MRQGNGSELLGVNDPRSSSIGMIYVSPTDDRKSVLAAILTQEKLGRKQIAIVLPTPNKAFQRAVDFDDLKSIRKRLRAHLIFIAPGGSGPAEFARQRRFTVYSSLETYTESLHITTDDEASTPPASGPAREPDENIRRSRVVTSSAAPNASTPVTPPQQAIQHEDTTKDDDAVNFDPAVLGIAGTGAAMAAGSQWKQDEEDYAEPFETGYHTPDDADDDLPPIAPVPTTPGGKASLDNAVFNTAHLPDDPPATPHDDEPVPVGYQGRANEPNPVPIDLRRTPKKTKELIPDNSVPTTARRTSAQPQRDAGIIAAAGAAGLAANTATDLSTPSGALARPPASGRNVTTQRGPQTGGPVGPTGPGRSGGGRGGSNRPQRSRRGAWLIALALLAAVLLLSCVGFAYLQPATFNKVASNVPMVGNLLPQATVTITPDSHLVSKSYVVTGVTDPPNAAQLQISAPQPTTSNQSQTTVNGTGATHIKPQQAAGSLTFFNAAAFSQTVAAGTTFTIRNGLQIVNDQAAIIPAGNGATNGSATVPAHAVAAGTAGNMNAFTLRQVSCCATGIFVSNTAAFTGGADQKDYNFVKQSDVDAKANPLKDQLVQQSTNQLKAKIAQGEVLIGQPQCQPSVKADQPIGDQGTNIPSTTITVSVNCREQLYNQQQLQKLMENQLKTMATGQYGPNYGLIGAVQVKPTITKVNDGSVNMLVEAKGIWVSQPTDAQKSDWAKLIAGKTPADAISLLQSQKGISKASIQMNGNTLPSDPNKIVFSPEKVNGLPAIANPSVNTNPTINNLPNGDNQTPSEPGKGSKGGIPVL